MNITNTSSCSSSNQSALSLYLPICIGATALTSLTACVAVIVIFCWQRMLNRFIHRLIVYLLAYSIFISVALALRLTSSLRAFVTSEPYGPFCVFSGFLAQYSGWTILLSQTVIVAHIGCLVVLVEVRCTRPLGHHYLGITSAFESEGSRNAKRYAVCLELVYALAPALIPLLFVWVPFTTDDYGPAGLWCWIRRIDEESCELVVSGVIEQYTLWYGPLTVITLINTTVIIITIVTICKMVYHFKKSGETPTGYKNTLKQVLPILAYPIIFQIQSWFALANRLYGLLSSSRFLPLLIIHSIGSPSWGLLAAIASIIFFAVWKRKAMIKEKQRKRASSNLPALREENHFQFKESINETTKYQTTTQETV